MRSTTRLGIAARAGRWSARHRAKAIVGWLVFVLLAATIGGSAGRKELTTAETRDGQSAAASRTLERAGFERPAAEQVLVQVRGHGDVLSPRRASRDPRRRRRRPRDGPRHGRPLAAGPARRPGEPRRPFRGRPLRHEGQGGHRVRACGARAARGRRRRRPPPAAARRGVRVRVGHQGHQRHHRQGLLPRRVDLDPAHVRDPARRLRRADGGARAARCSRSPR